MIWIVFNIAVILVAALLAVVLWISQKPMLLRQLHWQIAKWSVTVLAALLIINSIHHITLL